MFTIRQCEGRSPHHVYPRGGAYCTHHDITACHRPTGNHKHRPKAVQQTWHRPALRKEPEISYRSCQQVAVARHPQEPPPFDADAHLTQKLALTTGSSPPKPLQIVDTTNRRLRLRHLLPVRRPSSCSLAQLLCSRARSKAGQVLRAHDDCISAPTCSINELRLHICCQSRELPVVEADCIQYPIITCRVHLRPL